MRQFFMINNLADALKITMDKINSDKYTSL